MIVCKKSDKDQFLYECSTTDKNDDVVRQLTRVWNMRLKLLLLSGAVQELSKHGPCKPEAERGLDDVTDEAAADRGAVAPSRGPNYNPDPAGQRTGEAPSAQLQAVLQKVSEDGMRCCSADQVARKVALTEALLQEKIDTIRGAVTMAYPMGLPKCEPIRTALEDVKHEELIYGPDCLDPELSTLWWAGKEFHRDQTVADRVGRNEKTKVVAKLQKPGSGPPMREAVVSEDERKAMMAHYFKKQEEAKLMAENDEDDYHNSSWANPKALKASLNGTSSIGWR